MQPTFYNRSWSRLGVGDPTRTSVKIVTVGFSGFCSTEGHRGSGFLRISLLQIATKLLLVKTNIYVYKYTQVTILGKRVCVCIYV